jgi:hypothetical protein
MTWAPDYATAEELASYVGVDDNRDDEEFGLAVTAASRAIDRRTARQFGSSAVDEVRYYTAQWSRTRGAWVVETDDYFALTAVDLDNAGDGTYSTPLLVASAAKLPVNSVALGLPWERFAVRQNTVGWSSTSWGVDAIRVTGTWGWQAVPDTIKQACLLQGSRVKARQNSPFGVAGSPDTGSELRLLAKLDPDVQTMVEHYRRRRWTA